MPERVVNDEDSPRGKTLGDLTRRGLLGGFLALTGAAALGALPRTAEASEERISNARIVKVRDHNMPAGFSRTKIEAELDGVSKVIGSAFFLEDGHAKAEFITKKANPKDFGPDGRPQFESIQSNVSARGDKVVLVGAGAFFKSDGQTKGIALEKGQMVGDDQAANELNGILVIRNGVPSIEYLNQLPDPQAFFEQAKGEGWSLFQQTSYLRPGGKFHSSNPTSYELRFFVEGEGKKAVINFTEGMTHAEAVQALQNLAGFKVEKAIGLDTGAVSEARFFDEDGKAYTMVDEQFGKGRGYTNVFALYSDL